MFTPFKQISEGVYRLSLIIWGLSILITFMAFIGEIERHGFETFLVRLFHTVLISLIVYGIMRVGLWIYLGFEKK